MRIALALAAVVVTLGATSRVASAQAAAPASKPAPAAQGSARFFVTVPSRDSFARLFLPAQVPTVDVGRPASPAINEPVVPAQIGEKPVLMMKKPAVACGMAIAAGDAKVDPAMPHPIPERAANASMKTISAPPCVK